MFADKGYGRDDDALAVSPGALDLVIGGRPDPFQAPDLTLVAHHGIEFGHCQFAHDGGGGLPHLFLVRITAFDDTLGQTVRRQQQAPVDLAVRAVHGGADALRGGADKARLVRIAANFGGRLLQPRPLRRPRPVLQRRARGGAGELRIQRQKHDFIRAIRLDRHRRAVAEGVPVAHGNEGLRLHITVRQRRFQRARLLLRFRHDGRAAADLGIDLARNRRAAFGDEPA